MDYVIEVVYLPPDSRDIFAKLSNHADASRNLPAHSIMMGFVLMCFLLAILTVRADVYGCECSGIASYATRATGTDHEEELFGFRSKDRRELQIKLSVHFVVDGLVQDVESKREELKRNLSNFSRSKLRSDLENIAGIKFLTSIYVHLSDGATAAVDDNSIWRAMIGQAAFCKVGLADGRNNFTILAGSQLDYRDQRCVYNAPRVSDYTDGCSFNKSLPLLSSKVGCNIGRNTVNFIRGYPLDKFKYNYSSLLDAADEIVVQLVTTSGKVVFASSRNMDYYVLKVEQKYFIRFVNNVTKDVTIEFDFQLIKHGCISAREYVQRWLSSDTDIVEQDRLHLILSSRVEPTYDYETFSDAGLIMKHYNLQTFWKENSTYLWLSILKLLGGTLYTPELCEDVVSSKPLTVDVEMLRCLAVNAARPYARGMNSIRIKLEFLLEATHKTIYIPTVDNHGDVLCCSNYTKLCMWGECPVILKRPEIPSLPSITYFRLVFFLKEKVNVAVNLAKVSYWLTEVAGITEPVNDLCKKEHTIKLTIEVSDVRFYTFNAQLGALGKKLINSQLFYDGIGICARHIVASYDCNEIEEYVCPQHNATKIKTWHIISLGVTIAEVIIVIVLSCFIYFRVWKKRARPLRRPNPDTKQL